MPDGLPGMVMTPILMVPAKVASLSQNRSKGKPVFHDELEGCW